MAHSNNSQISTRIASIAPVICLLFAVVSCGRSPEQAKAHHIERAKQYLAAGKTAEGILELRNAVAADPKDGSVRLMLADAWLANRDAASALPELVRAADLLPTRVDVQLKAGSLLLLTGRFDDAKVRAETGLAADPASVELHLLLANSLAGLKDLEAAVVQIEEALRLEPTRAASYANLGALEAGRGKDRDAEKAFKKALELDPSSASAHLAIANFYWTAGRAAETESALNRALELDPESVVAHRALAMFALSRNRTSDAETHLKRVVELTKSNDASLTLADFYVSQRNEPAARTILDSLANGDGGIATLARIRLASLDHIDGRKAEAYARLDEVLSRDRVNVDALLVKGYLLVQDKRLDEALTTVSMAVDAQKDSVAALYLRGRVHRMRHESEAAITDFESVLRLNPRATAARVELAQLHLAAGRSEASVAFAEEAAKADPKGGQAQLLLARGLMAKGEVQRAESIVARLAAEFPRSSAVLTQQGMLRLRRGDTDNARKSFEQALALDPSAIEAVAGLITLDVKAGRTAAARARADREVARTSGAIPSLMLAARTYIMTGDSRSAEDLLRKALASDAGHLPAYAALGQIYASERRLDAALREFDALVARDPRNVQAMTVAAILVEAQGHSPEATKRYERVLQIDPNAAVAANNLAWAYASTNGDLDRALELARVAHRELPNTSEVADTLGYVYLKKGMLPEAIEILTNTVSKHPDAYQAHFHLGLAMERSDDQKAAVKHLTEALRLKPDFDGASEARERLRAIESR